VIVPQLEISHDTVPGLDDVARGTAATYIEVATLVEVDEHPLRLTQQLAGQQHRGAH